MDRILIVDDFAENIACLTMLLEEEDFDIVSTNSGVRCLMIARSRPKPALILLDINMPVVDGLETLKILRSHSSTADIPVIMVSGNDSEDNVIKALNIGALDFVRKPIVYPILFARIQSALRLSKAQIELKKANVTLKELATSDPLTNCYNRRHFYALCVKELAKASRSLFPTAIMMIDIDHFKGINDKFGHESGDDALKKLVFCCSNVCRSSDIFGRVGGEEFAILCPETDQVGATELAEKLRAACEDMVIDSRNLCFSITISIGVVAIVPGEHLNDALKRADTLLYRAKRIGRNCVVSDSVHGIQRCSK